MIESHSYPALMIRGGRVIDPAAGRDEVGDLAVVDGRICDAAASDAEVVDATGLIVCPGLMDMHVHLREPGQEHKETIASGTAAAAAGGFTFVACMPNTSPPLDSPGEIQQVIERARDAGWCEVGPVGAITRGRQGREVCDFGDLIRSGAVAFSDDGVGVEDDAVMHEAFRRAREHDALLIQHCEYRAISAGGVMHLGDVSSRLGLPGLDPRSEEEMIERDIELCGRTGGRYHVAHISTARAIELVRQAKARGLPVTAEVCPHHLVLTNESCLGAGKVVSGAGDEADPNTKMHPPLRPRHDVDACRQGLLDGTIDCIVTDHAPHTDDEKAVGFLKAPPGIVGLETALGLAALAMIESGLADWSRLIGWFTTGPARVLRQSAPLIRAGVEANLTLIDPAREWTVDPVRFLSKGRNTPFGGWTLPAYPAATIRGRTIIRRSDA